MAAFFGAEEIWGNKTETDELEPVILAGVFKSGDMDREYLIPYNRGNIQAYLMENSRVKELDYRDDGIYMKVSLNRTVAERADKMLQSAY